MTATILIFVLSFFVVVLGMALINTGRAYLKMGTLTPDEFSALRKDLIAINPARFDRMRTQFHGEGH